MKPLLLMQAAFVLSAMVHTASWSQYADLHPVLSASQPVVIEQTDGTMLAQLGPLRMAFPKGWRVLPSTIGSEAVKPSGEGFSVVVLEPSARSPLSFPEPISSIAKALSYFCTLGDRITVKPLASRRGHTVHLGSCGEGSGPAGRQYALFYELRSQGRIVQLVAAGRVNQAGLKAEIESIAATAEFE